MCKLSGLLGDWNTELQGVKPEASFDSERPAVSFSAPPEPSWLLQVAIALVSEKKVTPGKRIVLKQTNKCGIRWNYQDQKYGF